VKAFASHPAELLLDYASTLQLGAEITQVGNEVSEALSY
jgi:hypothetical protein